MRTSFLVVVVVSWVGMAVLTSVSIDENRVLRGTVRSQTEAFRRQSQAMADLLAADTKLQRASDELRASHVKLVAADAQLKAVCRGD